MNLITSIYLWLVFFIHIVAILFIFVINRFRKTITEQHREILEKEKAYEKQLLKSITEAQEKEQKKIQSNLHDDINPLLGVIKMYLLRIENNPEKKELIGELTKEGRKLLDQCTETIRNLSDTITPASLHKLGLMEGLHNLITQINKTGAIIISFDYPEAPPKLDKNKEIQVFRIIQEGLKNIMVHSACTKIRLTVKEGLGEYIFTISHNGDGITNESALNMAMNEKANGLRNIYARAKSIGGTVEYKKTNELSETIIYLAKHEN